jgi:intracellular septation protein A
MSDAALLPELELASPARAGSILRQSGPRFLRDVLGPLLAFYAGWKTTDLVVVGVAAATAVALTLYAYERRHGRPGMVARIALGIVFIRAGVGIATGSAKLYLGQDVIIDSLLASAWLGSLFTRRSLADLFVREIYPLPPEVRESETYRTTFRRVSLVWGLYFAARAAIRLAVVLLFSVDAYVAVAVATEVPLVLLLAWSVLYSLRRFRSSEEWGPALAALAEAEAQAESASQWSSSSSRVTSSSARLNSASKWPM